MSRGGIFDVFVRIENVSGLAAYDGMVTFNATILQVVPNGVSLMNTICDPAVASCEPQPSANGLPTPRFNNQDGTILVDETLTGYPTGFSGRRGNLLKITFEVVGESGSSALRLVSDPDNPCTDPSTGESQWCLLDTSFNVSPPTPLHNEVDGRFLVGPAAIRIDPNPTFFPVNSFFDVFVTIDNVVGLQAYDGMVQFDPNVLTIPANGVDLAGTICDPSVATCEASPSGNGLLTPRFNDQTGQIIVDETLTGYPLGFSTPPSGRLLHIRFQVLSDTGSTFIQIRSDPDNPCSNPITGETDQWCLLNINLNTIPHGEKDGRFGVTQTLCHMTVDPVSLPVDRTFTEFVQCDTVAGLFAYGGLVQVDPSVLMITNVSLTGTICDPNVAACEAQPSPSPTNSTQLLPTPRFNAVTGQVFVDEVLTGYPTGFSGDAPLIRIDLQVLNDTGASSMQLKSLPNEPQCFSKQADQWCLDDASFNQIPHDEKDGSFVVTLGVVRVNPLFTTAPVASFFDIFVSVDTVRGLTASAGEVKFDSTVVMATEASVSDPGTICNVAFCEITDPGSINNTAGTVTWEFFILGFPHGFSGSNNLIHIRFQVMAKGASILELKSNPSDPCSDPVTGETDQVCILDETFRQISHTERDGLFSVNPPLNPTAALQPVDAQKINLGDTVVFGGSTSVDNNSPPQPITMYQFYVNGVLAQSGASFFFSFMPSAVGDYSVTVVVCDAIRLCGSASNPTLVTVNPTPKRAPVPDFIWDANQDGIFENGQIFVSKSATFKSISTDPNGQNLTIFNWDFNGDHITDATGPMVKWTFNRVEVVPVSLTVCDTSKLCNTETRDLSIMAFKVAPTAVISGPAKVTSGMTVTYSGSLSHDNSQPRQTITYRWVNASGAVLGTGVNVTITFTQPKGSYSLSLTVTDQSNLTNTQTLMITVNPQPFVANLILPGGAYVTEPASFTISVHGGSPPYTCTVNFGDGTATQTISPCTNGQVITHTYSATGTFTITFRATGANTGEDSGTITKTLTVQPEPLFIQDKVSWKHHLTTSGQVFVARIKNPSSFTVKVIVMIAITKPDATTDQISGTFTLGPGATNTNAMIPYTASMLGKYCFTATLQYQVDFNGDGIIDLTGTGPNSKSGCFTRV